jgi:hypothetical protein
MQKGDVTVIITLENGEKIEFGSPFEVIQLIYTDCYIYVKVIATWDYSSYEVGLEEYGTAKGNFWGNRFIGVINKQDDVLR